MEQIDYSVNNKSDRAFAWDNISIGIHTLRDYTPFELVFMLLKPLCKLNYYCTLLVELHENISQLDFVMYHAMMMYMDLVKLSSNRS